MLPNNEGLLSLTPTFVLVPLVSTKLEYLVYAVSQSIIHLVSALFYSLHVLAAAVDSFALRVVANSALAYLTDVVCFSSPICLMITR